MQTNTFYPSCGWETTNAAEVVRQRQEGATREQAMYEAAEREHRADKDRRNAYRATSKPAVSRNCSYCDTPLDRGTVCDRCARACGERDWSDEPDYFNDGYDD